MSYNDYYSIYTRAFVEENAVMYNTEIEFFTTTTYGKTAILH